MQIRVVCKLGSCFIKVPEHQWRANKDATRLFQWYADAMQAYRKNSAADTTSRDLCKLPWLYVGRNLMHVKCITKLTTSDRVYVQSQN